MSKLFFSLLNPNIDINNYISKTGFSFRWERFKQTEERGWNLCIPQGVKMEEVWNDKQGLWSRNGVAYLYFKASLPPLGYHAYTLSQASSASQNAFSRSSSTSEWTRSSVFCSLFSHVKKIKSNISCKCVTYFLRKLIYIFHSSLWIHEVVHDSSMWRINFNI